MPDQTYPVGYAGSRVQMRNGWRVLDVGSGHNPNARADVLLESHPDTNEHRAGAGIDGSDPRLVVGDACAMPFADSSFDYIIASHIAEHVDDPVAFCAELVRVGAAGYIETPGWWGDRILREDFHRWRVRRVGDGLQFQEVGPGRPAGRLGEGFYRIVYYDRDRPGHQMLRFKSPLLDVPFKGLRLVVGTAMRLPLCRRVFFTCFEWRGPFPVSVEWLSAPERPTPPSDEV